jgi:hypothetical protein
MQLTQPTGEIHSSQCMIALLSADAKKSLARLQTIDEIESRRDG